MRERRDGAEDGMLDARVVPGAVHRIDVASRDDSGRGIATLAGRELRIPNALAGERLDVRLSHVGRRIAIGRIVTVVRPAAERVPDECPHGAVCPGCGLRTSSAASRRALKRSRLVRALVAQGLPADLVAETVPAPVEDGWRHKAFLTPRHTRRGILLGLFEEHSHRLLPIPGCPAHAPPVEAALLAVRQALARVDSSIYDERKHAGWLRHVSVRASSATGDAVVVLVMTERQYAPERALVEEILRVARNVVGVVANVHPERGNAPYGPEFVSISGTDALEEASGPFSLKVSAGSFFQVNPAVAAVMQDRIGEAAATAPAGMALDLYGGVGVASVRLAASGRPVVLVEASAASATDAEANVKRHAPGRVEVTRARVEDALEGLLTRAPSVVVANPPRGGLAEKARNALRAAAPSLLLYVSCDPLSLARDAAAFQDSALALESVTPFDLMPQTPHVEALAVWRRRA